MSQKDIEVIAFYLPQYYPTPENNEWYGPGFTEWTNVGKAKPLFKGHYQPKVPADLGYYDLRLPQVRRAQADLAREAGISAFCYYHYWFGNGKEMLDMPLKEVLRTKEPDFPFCLCWANHSWYKKTWNSSTNTLDNKPLLLQSYPGIEDIDAQRYYKINGQLVFVLYHIDEMPDAQLFIDRWQELAKKEELPPFYFMGYADDYTRMEDPYFKLCQKTIVSGLYNISSMGKSRRSRKLSTFARSFLSKLLSIPLNRFSYSDVRRKLVMPCYKEETIIPLLIPNWDNTPRRESGALILHDATPEQFHLHCKDVFNIVKEKENKLVFLKSWNEWGEGNYMEPCLKYGHGYIQSLRKALEENRY